MLKSSGLTGRSDHRVDSKGRLNIPASMRKVLAPDDHDEVVVLLVPDGHLLLFNREYWSETIQQSIMDRTESIGSAAVWRAINRLSENAHMSTVDSQGRITIPSRLLKSSGIDGNAVVIGAFDRVFVWNPDNYDQWIGDNDVDSTIADIGIL
ncbi:division/cell wall cluster transcriptional repressor MraZ [Candidatus Latescibacterota bacterium]